MRRIYVTLLGRTDKPQDSPADVGELIVLDWDTQTILRRVIVDSGNLVEKGRSRGATGIDWHDDHIYIGCRSGMVKMDPETYDYAVIERDIPGGMHQVKSHDGKLYLTGTGDNSLVIFEHDRMIKKISLQDPKQPLHFNSIGWDSKGDQYHLYLGDPSSTRPVKINPSRIVNYTTGHKIHGNLGRLPHDLCFINNERLLYTASGEGKLISMSLKGERHYVLFSKALKSNPHGGYRIQGLLRGLAFCEETNSVFVGAAPGMVHEVDADTGKEKNCIDFSNSAGTAVYDLLLHPVDWIPREPEPELEVVAAIEITLESEEVIKLTRWERFRNWFKKESRKERKRTKKKKKEDKKEIRNELRASKKLKKAVKKKE